LLIAYHSFLPSLSPHQYTVGVLVRRKGGKGGEKRSEPLTPKGLGGKQKVRAIKHYKYILSLLLVSILPQGLKRIKQKAFSSNFSAFLKSKREETQ
jgi:hypothetical protein